MHSCKHFALTFIRCPAATRNPKTKKPFCDKTIKNVFLEDCYDFDPSKPWKMQSPLQKIFLPEDVKVHRKSTTWEILNVQAHGNDHGWWLRNVVWVDPCCSIVPRSRRQYDRMRMAEFKNSKRLISDDARMYNRNLRGPKESLKQACFEAERISWLMVLARGVVAVLMLPPGWRVTGEGMAAAVKQLPDTLRRMLGTDTPLPRMLFTDRGTGVYTPNGHIVSAFSDAVTRAGFRTYWGESAKKQAPDMGDLLLHETAVAWFRGRMKREKPQVYPWLETRLQWAARAARCVRHINDNYDGAGLCRGFPERLQACFDTDGERIAK
jgi:hypothetical protein